MNHTTPEEGTKRRIRQRVFLVFLLLFPSLAYLFFSTGRENFLSLPYYGPRETVEVERDGKKVTDTLYHTVPPFAFTNQDGRMITEKTLEGKIYVTDYFFATCQSICPKMTSNMLRVQERFKDTPGLVFLSHTVDPEHDTAEVLQNYAMQVHADTSNWYFVTGDKKSLYDQARYGYFITAMEGDGGAEDFIHSEKLVLVDRERHIRGFYDGTTVASVDSLIDDIRVLMADYARRTQAEKEKIEQRK